MNSPYPYRRFPTLRVADHDGDAAAGAEAIRQHIAQRCAGRPKTVLVAECYPGVDQEELLSLLQPLHPVLTVRSDELALPAAELDALVARDLTQDPVFGIMTTRRLEEFYPAEGLAQARRAVEAQPAGLVLVLGVGASLVCRGDLLLLADVTRWELQLRYRRGMPNWHTEQTSISQREKYKRGFFAEWRWGDRVKDRLLPHLDFYLDMTTAGQPVLATGQAYRAALAQAAGQPFRMAPYFDPGIWGGDWMKTHFDLPDNGSNYAWSFDGVPEENSLLLDFGGTVLQTPAQNLVLAQPEALLGTRVHARFGKEFPIRFDLLDTIHGQNLSLQVHPLTEYIQQTFNMHYTQDESYYLLDAEGDDPCVYLGIKTGTQPEEMLAALARAQKGDAPFPAERYVNRIPVKRHDHILIPAGTVHCSGANTMVLEISATPYIFTFKLWDWGRLDLDGKPRPIHLQHGAANIQWQRDTAWVQQNLVNAITVLHQGADGTVERTGLHEREFLDTWRLTTRSGLDVARNGSVYMMNLVQGQHAQLHSTEGRFAPFELHYAETCILPQAAGAFRLVSPDGEEIKLMLAAVRG